MHYGRACAKKELEFLLSRQWSSGMFAHTNFGESDGYAPGPGAWGLEDSSGIIQPPMLAIAADRLLRVNGDEQLLRKALAQIRSYHAFLRTCRDPDNTGLIAIFHPWASGTDNSPVYDEALMRSRELLADRENAIPLRKDQLYADADERPRDEFYDGYGKLITAIRETDYDQQQLYEDHPFVIQDVLVNTVFVQALLAEERLCRYAAKQLADDSYAHQASLAHAEADKTIQGMREHLYDEQDGLFYAYDVRGGHLIREPTIHSLLPLWGVADEHQAQSLLTHVRSEQFWPQFGVASTSGASECFEARRYWRGPVWPVTNYLLIHGLRIHDQQLAQRLAGQTLELVGEDDPDAEEHAQQVLANNWHERLSCTLPSAGQYPHCWFWDSCFCIIGWLHVQDKPGEWNNGSSFAEYYDARSGEPLGAQGMAWSAALYLELEDSH